MSRQTCLFIKKIVWLRCLTLSLQVSAMTQDNVDAFSKVCPSDKSSEDDVCSLAENLITEAENSKQLLSALHEVTSRGAEDIDAKLKKLSQELSQFISARLVNFFFYQMVYSRLALLCFRHKKLAKIDQSRDSNCPHLLSALFIWFSRL